MENQREVRCVCRRIMFDGQVVKARVVKVADDEGRPLPQAVALCKCKRWVAVPVAILPPACDRAPAPRRSA